ncbi:MAG: ABC transporter permease [Spirochaetales bacterium]|jgi:lipoprotein-releasing system permease protein|nr:ABC transporter permease [Spirochaetales bacterium]
MIRPSLYFGLRQLTSRTADKSYRRIRGAIIGICLSLIPMVVVLQVSGGLIRGITERYLELGTFHLQGRNFIGVSDKELTKAAEAARAIGGVSDVYEIRNGIGLLQTENGRTGVTVQALPLDLARTGTSFSRLLEIESGDLELARDDAVMLSVPIALQLEAEVGSTVKLLTARSTSTGRYILRQSELVVAGIFSTGYHELDEATVMISAARGAKLLREDESSMLAFRVEDPYGDLGPVKEKLQKSLGLNWYVFTWYQLEEGMYSTFETTKNLLILIMAVIILVAGVNISGGLVMLVMEKERDIAILRGCGVSSARISSAFVGLGLVTGFLGTALGMGLGIFSAVHINEIIGFIEKASSWIRYALLVLGSQRGDVQFESLELLSSTFYLDHIPIVLNPGELILTGILSLGVATLSSILPARKAGKLLPVEVLRRH